MGQSSYARQCLISGIYNRADCLDWYPIAVEFMISVIAALTSAKVGNFPQAFSHLALVNSTSNLAHYKKPTEQRSQLKYPPIVRTQPMSLNGSQCRHEFSRGIPNMTSRCTSG